MNIRKSLFLFILPLIIITDCFADYVAIRGIPTPPTIIDADVDDYIGLTYNFSLDGRGVQTYPINSVTGHPYTHYVDKDHVSATDTDNPYGTESVPRLTIPCEKDANPDTAALYVAEGSVIEIHNGTYDLGYSGGYDGYSIYCNGSESKPIFIRGEDNATLGHGYFNITGQYAVFENMILDYTFIGMSKLTVAAGGTKAPDHCCIRNCTGFGDGTPEVHNFIIFQGIVGAKPSYNVVYNNTAYNYGEYDTVVENDAHFISINVYSEYIWVLNNTSYNMGGDGVQAGNNAAGTSHHIYIGGNTFYGNRENAIDIKEADDVIISHNDFHTFGFNNSYESAIGIHKQTVDPDNIWVLFNRIHNCTGSGGIGLSGGTNIYVIGNLLYDMTHHYIYTSRAIYSPTIQPINENHFIINNTIYNCQAGFWKNADTDEPAIHYVANNIFDTLQNGTGGNKKHIWIEVVADDSKIITDYNLFYQSGGTELINFADVDYNLTTYVAATTNGDHSVAGSSPAFVTPGSDFSLQSGSPAKGTGLWGGNVQAAYEQFETEFGISIEYDIADNPLSSPPNMGCYQGESISNRYLFGWTN